MTTIDHLAEVARARGVIVGASTLALGAGFLAGYYFAKHRLEQKIHAEAEAKIEQQVEAARKHYTVIAETDTKPLTPADAIEAMIPEAAEALRVYQGQHSPVDDGGNVIVERSKPFDEVRRINIWNDGTNYLSEGADFSEEIALRSLDAPYIIAEHEYLNNDPEHQQMDITFYAVDKVFIDENEQAVEDPDDYFGKDNVRFGHMNDDPRIVYIRNPKYRYDFLITLNETSYAELGGGFIPGDPG